MKNTLIKSLVVALLIGSSSIAFAEEGGNSGGGGGDAVKTKSGYRILDLVEASAGPTYFDPYSTDTSVVNIYDSMQRKLSNCSGTIGGELLVDALRFGGPGRLHLYWIKSKNVSELHDEGAVRMYVGEKVQLAVQTQGAVFVNMDIYDQLNTDDRAALVMHENLVRLLSHYNPLHLKKHGTSQIRQLVNLLARSDSQYQGPLFGICAAGSDMFPSN